MVVGGCFRVYYITRDGLLAGELWEVGEDGVARLKVFTIPARVDVRIADMVRRNGKLIIPCEEG